MGDVVNWPGVTKLDLPPERVLRAALDAKLSGVVILGYTEDGREYFASSYADGGEVVWLTERAKLALFRKADEIAGID